MRKSVLLQGVPLEFREELVCNSDASVASIAGIFAEHARRSSRPGGDLPPDSSLTVSSTGPRGHELIESVRNGVPPVLAEGSTPEEARFRCRDLTTSSDQWSS